ncbi:MAG: 3-isopropylmalate dehydratase large subunit [Clostridiales bacterium]|nr:3-isopropylmalate dehydratase large subunit [Candidatus Crickella merdequi]
MGMTMTQKILAAHVGVESVKAGELVEARLDLCMSNDITSPVSADIFEQAGFDKVFDKDKVAIILDHYTPCKDIDSARLSKKAREFAKKQDLTHFYDTGVVGIEHALVPEKGLAAPGEIIIGADSHTCTYGALGAFSTGVGSTDLAASWASGQSWFKVPSAIKVMLTGKPSKWVTGKDVILHLIGEIGVDGALYKSIEFAGPGVAELSMDDRFTISNMAIEAGGKNGIFPVDEKTLEYIKGRVDRPYNVYEADEDAEYERVVEINLSELKNTVSLPHLPSNTRTVDEVKGTHIDSVVIGSCTNGRMEDMRIAAEIFKDRKVAKGIRVNIVPATQDIYLQCIEEGIMKIFIEAGCAVNTPSCGPCMGGHMGVMCEGERTISTTNRNFVGRMGHVESEIILASPAVAAASAVAGYVAGPEDIM